MKTLTLKERFIALIALLLFVFISIGIFSYYSFSKVKQLNEVANVVQELEITTLNLRKNEMDFLNKEVKNPDYFKTGKSKSFDMLNANIEKAIEQYEILHNSRFVNQSAANPIIDNMKKYFVMFGETFTEVEKATRLLGYKDWGLIGELRASIHNVEEMVTSLGLDKAKIQMLTLRRREKDYLLRKDLAYKNKFAKDIENFYTILDELYIKTSERKQIKTLLADYEEKFYKVIELDQKIGLTENQGLLGELKTDLLQIEPDVKEIHSIVLDLTESNINRAIFILVLFIVIGTILVTVFSILIMRVIFNLLGGEPTEVARIAHEIADGNLMIEFDSSNNYSGLLQAMVIMKEKLDEILKGVVINANTIVSTSAQLSNTSEQISQGANEQASSVEEVSSTVEQISANIQQNTDNSQQTDKIATNAHAGIQEVNEQSMASLDANRTITDKIKIINDIAFQTNILALNAAVEAARAGEHGKGFAVVAAEVRKLAERSKTAADDIISLTENSLELSENAGNKLTDMLPEIKKTSDLIQEITAASVEQNNGVNQVNGAIQQLSSITQQNASASEEMAASAKELENQAVDLKNLVSYFKLKNVQLTQPKKVEKKAPKKKVKTKQKSTIQPLKSTSVDIDLSDSDFEKF